MRRAPLLALATLGLLALLLGGCFKTTLVVEGGPSRRTNKITRTHIFGFWELGGPIFVDGACGDAGVAAVQQWRGAYGIIVSILSGGDRRRPLGGDPLPRRRPRGAAPGRPAPRRRAAPAELEAPCRAALAERSAPGERSAPRRRGAGAARQPGQSLPPAALLAGSGSGAGR